MDNISNLFLLKLNLDPIFTVHLGTLEICSIYKYEIINKHENSESISLYINSYYNVPEKLDIIPRNYWQWTLFAQALINFNSLPNWIYMYLGEYESLDQLNNFPYDFVQTSGYNCCDKYWIDFSFVKISVVEKKYI